MNLHVECLLSKKTAPILAVLFLLIYGCSHQNGDRHLTIGLGKANLTNAGIYEDPVPANQVSASGDKYRWEEKFAISDQVEGRWRPGSGSIRHIADSIYVSAMYGEDADGPWSMIALDETEIFYKLLDTLEYPLIPSIRDT